MTKNYRIAFFTINVKCAIVILIAWLGRHCELLFHLGEKSESIKTKIKKYAKQMLVPGELFLSLCASYISIVLNSVLLVILFNHLKNATIEIQLFLFLIFEYVFGVGLVAVFDSYRMGWKKSPGKANEELVRAIIRYCETKNALENSLRKTADIKTEEKKES